MAQRYWCPSRPSEREDARNHVKEDIGPNHAWIWQDSEFRNLFKQQLLEQIMKKKLLLKSEAGNGFCISLIIYNSTTS